MSTHGLHLVCAFYHQTSLHLTCISNLVLMCFAISTAFYEPNSHKKSVESSKTCLCIQFIPMPIPCILYVVLLKEYDDDDSNADDDEGERDGEGGDGAVAVCIQCANY